MTVTNNTTDNPSIYISTIANGVTGIHQVDNCTFSATPTAGSMTFNGGSIAYSETDLSGSSPIGCVLSGGPSNQPIVTTWDDYGSHTPLTVSADTLEVTGQPMIWEVELTDSPTEGNWKLDLDGVVETSDIAYDATDAAVEAVIDAEFWGVGVTQAGVPWVITTDDNNNPGTLTGEEGATPLRKAATITPSTLQEGVSTSYIHSSNNPNVNLFISFIEGF